MKLIITEKKTMSDMIKKSLSEENVIFAEIGGHIYTKDECNYIKVSDEELSKSKKITLSNNEEGYILGEETINKNIENIRKLLSENNVNSIVYACEADKNGIALCNYVNSLINFDSDKILISSYSDFVK